MATKVLQRGPVAARFGENLRGLRESKRMSLADLSAAMSAVGRPILKSGLCKIEMGDRRVDVDDLVALAVALDVSPARLLLCPDAGDELIELTATVADTKTQAWRWCAGSAPLGSVLEHQRETHTNRFRRENRPQAPAAEEILERISQLPDAFAALTAGIHQALASGMTAEAIQEYVEVVDGHRG
jgi:transcriptional regulator with XRE-family HTH domain